MPAEIKTLDTMCTHIESEIYFKAALIYFLYKHFQSEITLIFLSSMLFYFIYYKIMPPLYLLIFDINIILFLQINFC